MSGQKNTLLEWSAMALALLVLFLVGFRTLGNSDIWTHMAVGKAIAEHGVKAADTLTFSQADQTYKNPTWLYDLVMYKVYTSAGAGGVTLLHILAVIGGVALTIPLARAWGGGFSVALVLLLNAWLLAPRFEPRPDTFALLFAGCCLFGMGTIRNPWVGFAILVPVQLLWANMAPTFILAPLIAVAAGFQITRGFTLDGRDASNTSAVPYWMLAGALLVLPILNPFGPAVYWGAFKNLLANDFIQTKYWVSPYRDQFTVGLSAHSVNLALILGAGGLLFLKNRLPIGISVLAVLSALLVVRSIMLLEQFIILAFPFICLSVASTGESLMTRIAGPDPAKRKWAEPALLGLIVLITVAVAGNLVTNSYYIGTGHPSGFGLGENNDTLPSGALKVLEEHATTDHIINQPVDAGYLSLKSTRLKTFVDQRSGFFQKEFMEKYYAALMGQDEESWKAFESTWDPQLLLLNFSTREAPIMLRRVMSSGTWGLAYSDGFNVILARINKANEPLLKNIEIKREGFEALAAHIAAQTATVGEGSGQPVSARLVGAGSFFLNMNRFNEARAAFNILYAAAPRMPKAGLHLGICELSLGHHEAALRLLEESVETEPNNVLAWLHLSNAYRANDRQADADAAFQHAGNLNPEAAEAFRQQQLQKSKS